MPGIRDYLLENLPEEFRVVGLDKVRGTKETYKMIAAMGEALRVIRGEAASRYNMPRLESIEGGLYSNDSASATTAVRHVFGSNLLLRNGIFDEVVCARVYLEGDATNGVYIEANFPGKYGNFEVVTKVAAADVTVNSIAASVTNTNKDPFTITLTLDPDIDWQSHVTPINNVIGGYARIYAVGTNKTAKPTSANHGTTSSPVTRKSVDDVPGQGPGVVFKVGKYEVQNTLAPDNTNRFGSLSSYVGPWKEDYIRVAVNKGVLVDGKAIDSSAGVNLTDGAVVEISFEIPYAVRLQLMVPVVKG